MTALTVWNVVLGVGVILAFGALGLVIGAAMERAVLDMEAVANRQRPPWRCRRSLHSTHEGNCIRSGCGYRWHGAHAEPWRSWVAPVADDNIVQLFPGTEKAEHEAPLRTKERPPFCEGSHKRLELDTEARRIYCKDCGREIPAFDALLDLIRYWERYLLAIKEAKRSAAHHQERLDEVKRKERNAKARVRRIATGGEGAIFEALAEAIEGMQIEAPPFEAGKPNPRATFNIGLERAARVAREGLTAELPPLELGEARRG